MHLRALAEDGVPIEHQEGIKETFMAVVSGKDVIKALSKTGYYVRDQRGRHVGISTPFSIF